MPPRPILSPRRGAQGPRARRQDRPRAEERNGAEEKESHATQRLQPKCQPQPSDEDFASREIGQRAVRASPESGRFDPVSSTPLVGLSAAGLANGNRRRRRWCRHVARRDPHPVVRCPRPVAVELVAAIGIGHDTIGGRGGHHDRDRVFLRDLVRVGDAASYNHHACECGYHRPRRIAAEPCHFGTPRGAGVMSHAPRYGIRCAKRGCPRTTR